MPALDPRYNIAPTQSVAAARILPDGKREAAQLSLREPLPLPFFPEAAQEPPHLTLRFKLDTFGAVER